ncbi:MAG: hypothetical protein COZ76_03775 [Flavobacteriales bacterium CG_4_8_14_3_um_filter_35_10]|nr:MAG: hypothetical protein AUJ53_01835 [Flavobacteriaceae bacterium CG1_02_35_72]PIX07358.1 MAG: hypothetical protein COZ76_03775 [Flavobacteriales bacterium CG_4_8_14_3_um_filter_35_10]PJA05917.1 MAG: hypothetical protein COX71_04220 [Flavobacteriales bacterium CG_4_10_14_0_2_um_filter_35_18]
MNIFYRVSLFIIAILIIAHIISNIFFNFEISNNIQFRFGLIGLMLLLYLKLIKKKEKKHF